MTGPNPEARFIMGGQSSHGRLRLPVQYLRSWLEIHAPALEQLPLKGDTVIGNDVWIGRRASIMPGVTIGDGAIIGGKR